MRNNVLRSSVFAMSFLSSEERVRHEAAAVLNQSTKKSRSLPFVSPVATKLTAVRFEPRRFSKPRALISHWNTYLDEAEDAGSPMVAFPELTGLCALGLLPGANQVIAALQDGLRDTDTLRDTALETVQTMQGFVGEFFLNAFSELARGHRMLLAAGGFYVVENGEILNRQYLFSENGEVLTHQDKLILSPLERAAGVRACPAITPADTRIGRVALLTASCAPHYEPFIAASALGCRVVTAGASPFGEDTGLLRCRAQEQGLCVVSAGARGGQDFGLSLATDPVIYAPRTPMRSTRDGIAPAGKTRTVTARVDLSAEAPRFDRYTADRNDAFFAALLSDHK
jgi:predicted amidohydrolase